MIPTDVTVLRTNIYMFFQLDTVPEPGINNAAGLKPSPSTPFSFFLKGGGGGFHRIEATST